MASSLFGMNNYFNVAGLMRFFLCCSVQTLIDYVLASTKMKGQARYLNAVLAISCLVGLQMLLEAEGAILTADQLLAQKVDEVNRFVGVIEANSRNCGTRLTYFHYRFQDALILYILGVD